MNQRRYIEHNLFLQSAYTKHINQVLLRSYSTPYSSLNQVSLRFCSGLAQVSLRSCSSLVKVLTQYLTIPYSSLTQVLIKSCSSLTQHLTQVLHNISPRNFNEFGNTFFYS